MNSTDSTVTMPIPLSTVEEMKAKIEDLKEALQKNLPGYESILHTIHRNLATDPDTVHLLSEEEIGIICAGLSKRTGIVIAQEAAKKRSTSKNKAGLEDLM